MKNSEKILKSISSLIENGILTSKDIRKEILASGDARVIEVLSLFPDEALVKLKRILNKTGQ